MVYTAQLSKLYSKANCTVNYIEKGLKKMSGRADSNRRPPRPKRGALTELRHTPKRLKLPW